jgi:catechol 2,3-dioxygenase-like lactoylglutathione lyase family enzyme
MKQERLMANLRQVQPVLMSRDVEASIRFYAKLGFDVAFRDDPDRVRYAGVRRDGVELHLQWHDAKEWEFPNDRPTYRFVVDDVDGLWAEFRERGIVADVTDVRDTPWGTREFHLRDPDRNGLQFYRDL